jgi:hypothetical protein
VDQLDVAEQLAPPLQPALGEHTVRPSAPTSAPESSPPTSFVFALGQVDPRFPSLAVEKEFAQVTGRADTAGQTDRQVLQTIFADRENDRIMEVADNAGVTDEHRALNYLAVRYPAIYERTMQAHSAESSLAAVEVRPSRLGGSTRKIADVVFSYTHRRTDVTEKYFVRVDVTEELPFLVTKLSPFYER